MSNGVTNPGPELYLWGERGLVAALFLDISADTSFKRWEQFVKLIRFPGQGRLVGVWCVVEPDFGNKGFGHPDVVAKLTFEGGAEAVLLMEAKLTTCYNASWPSSRRPRKKFNSKLNGQIELNHRLALALERHDGNPDADLIEPTWLVGTDYITPNGLPRSLKDPAAVRLATELAGRLSDNYHHVIITTDEEHPAGRLAEDRRPLIVVQQGEGTAALPWESFRTRLLHCDWGGIACLAVGWQDSVFLKNYNFFGARLQVAPAATEVGENERLSPEGVRLIAPNEILRGTLGLTKPTYLHLSWKKGGASFKLRDFSSSPPRLLKTKGRIFEVLRNTETHMPYTISYRKMHKLDNKSEQWPVIVLHLNQTRWPEHWPVEGNAT